MKTIKINVSEMFHEDRFEDGTYEEQFQKFLADLEEKYEVEKDGDDIIAIIPEDYIANFINWYQFALDVDDFYSEVNYQLTK